MAEIVRFPRRLEVQKTEPTSVRRNEGDPSEAWAVLVPFGAEAGAPFAPLTAVSDDLEPPDKPAC